MQEQTINANFAECLKSVENFGYTHIVNVCNGRIVDVPWGHVDWVMAVLLAVLLLALVTVVIWVIVSD